MVSIGWTASSSRAVRGQVFGDVREEDEVHDGRVFHALRRRLAFMRARESFIIPLSIGATDVGSIWFDLYDREPLWLDRELVRAGLPTVGDMLPK